VAVVGAETFAIGGEPGADYLVFGAGEEDIAVLGVSVRRMSQRNVLCAGWHFWIVAHLIWVKDRSWRRYC